MKIPITVIKLNYKIICIIMLTIMLISFGCAYSASFALSKTGIKVPIIMYHSVLKSRSGDYIVTPDTLEKDLQYIQEKGYTTIVIQDLIRYVYENGSLPEKPIILTFDDGHYNNLGYVVPLLEKYHMKAVISIVGKYTDTYSETDEANLNYSYLRWKDIQELMQKDVIEFQNHTYDLHSFSKGRNGCMKKYKESIDTYQNVLTQDLQKLQTEFQENVHYQPTTFTYPFGAVSKESYDVIKDLGFKASLSCSSGINYITKNPECLYLLKRNNRTNGINRIQFFNKLLE